MDCCLAAAWCVVKAFLVGLVAGGAAGLWWVLKWAR